jgi:hypothetical protein
MYFVVVTENRLIKSDKKTRNLHKNLSSRVCGIQFQIRQISKSKHWLKVLESGLFSKKTFARSA